MELFTVQRYDTVERTHDPDREKRILENLQKNIDKKKHKLKKDKSHTVIPEPVAPVAEEPVTNDAADTEITDDVPAEATEPETAVPSAKAVANTLAVDSNFQVLGTDKFHNKKRIDMVLPPWLANPTIIANDLAAPGATGTASGESVDDLHYLSANVKSTLHSFGIHQLFPVQRSVIPWIIDVHAKPEPFRPRDLCVSAPTGSGKTLAYAVPIVQVLQSRLQRRIRALIVLPVNELAVQVLKQFRKLCEGTTLTCALLSKSVPFEAEQAQLVEHYESAWYSKVDIVVATAGRLVEHLHSTRGFCLKSLQFLVMDEADRIMEQIQDNWLYHLDAHVKEQSDAFLHGRAVPLCAAELGNPVNRQPHKLLFSATLSQDPEKLQNLKLFQPKLFTAIVKQFEVARRDGDGSVEVQQRGEFVGKFTTPAGLTERYCLTLAELKPLTLYSMIVDNAWRRWLCFTNSGESAHRLSFVLQQLLGTEQRVEELSSGLSPAIRTSVLNKFAAGQINGLVCSDALARGIDVPDVDVVVSYELPRHVKTYVHRVGRTARAGRLGLAVTVLLKHEQAPFEALIREAGKERVEELTVDGQLAEKKSKEFATVVERLQTAIKREQQMKVLNQVNEKQKAQQKITATGLFGQLQSQLHSSGADVHHQDEPNMPESWKWQNQQNIKARREGKNKKQRNKKLAKRPAGETAAAAVGANGDESAAPVAKKAKFTKSTNK